jgi:probable H4MPT-linked C1 transfer pathway protein
MTAELADCFDDKRQGVRHVVESCRQAFGEFFVYAIGGFLEPRRAVENPYQVAAANWHAIAEFAKRLLKNETGIVADCGSTTTDMIPIVDGQIFETTFTDTDRLLNGTLTYTGIKRTPVCAVVNQLPYGTKNCPVASELFATTEDAYVLLGKLPESHEDRDSADGRSKTRRNCVRRIGKMICADDSTYSRDDALVAAAAIAAQQKKQIKNSLKKAIANSPVDFETVVISGDGEFLLAEIFDELGLEIRSIANIYSQEISKSFGAFAVASLAAESKHLPDLSGFEFSEAMN